MLAQLQISMAVAKSRAGLYAESLKLYQQSLATKEACLGRDHGGLIGTLVEAAVVALRLGNRDTFDAYFDRAIDIIHKESDRELPHE
jgi:tetratricopeptide (TPR) repeat protein